MIKEPTGDLLPARFVNAFLTALLMFSNAFSLILMRFSRGRRDKYVYCHIMSFVSLSCSLQMLECCCSSHSGSLFRPKTLGRALYRRTRPPR